MKRRENLLLGGLLILILVLFWRVNDGKADALDLARSFEAEAAAALVLVAATQERADSVTADAVLSDSLAQVAQESADARVARARARPVLVDTVVVAPEDTVTSRRLAQRDTLWMAVVDSVEVALGSVIVQERERGDIWRASSFAKDTVIMGWVATDSLKTEANDALHAHIRSQKRRQWTERVAAVGVLACALMCR